MWKDVAKRPFITVGFLGFVLLIPLGADFHQRLDPPPRRQALASPPSPDLRHALCGVIHYYWLVKSDHRLPLLYGAILAVLLLYRLATSLLKPRSAGAVSPAPAP